MSSTCSAKKLFTPGPLCVSEEVRKALNRDVGSRDEEFLNIVKFIQQKLIQIADLTDESYATVLMQGSGTFAVEATFQSISDRKGKVLILASGAYGKRMGVICSRASIPYMLIDFPEHVRVTLDQNINKILATGDFIAVALVQCETTSGVLNNIEDIGNELKTKYPQILFIVDAMSSFGGIVTNYESVDFLISSANKCIQGVPGIAFVICKRKALEHCKDRSHSLCLDLYDQWAGFERNGQFRFTPPTHCMLGLQKALLELEAEGGVPGRAKRYQENNLIIKKGMAKLGFQRLVSDDVDGHIITSFKYPEHPNYSFNEFYQRLSQKGKLIYPGKVSAIDSFRIGNIGHLFPSDMEDLLDSIQQVLKEMKINL